MKRIECLRYGLRSGSVKAELLRFDPYTREPEDCPRARTQCQLCPSHGEDQHWLADLWDVWGVNADGVREHLARQLCLKEKESYEHIVGKVPDMLKTYFVLASIATVVWIAALVALAILSPDSFLITSWKVAMGYANKFTEVSYFGGGLWGLLVLIGGVGYFPFLILGLIYCRHKGRLERKRIRRILKTNNGIMPGKPSEDWRYYLGKIPEIEFPLPSEK